MDPRASGGGEHTACVGDVLDALGEVFPWELADGPERGLVAGSASAPVSRVICAPDMTRRLVEAAASSGSDMLVVHHPPVLPVNGGRLRQSGGNSGSAADVSKGVIGLAVCHRNADVAAGGTADLMADGIGLGRRAPLEILSGSYMAKVVVFVPDEALDGVFSAMSDAGAGSMGDYTCASFRTVGTGTFFPLEGASPFSGEKGRLNLVQETRLEMQCPSYRVKHVVAALLGQHPYEEVAYDIIRTENEVGWGVGRVGDLEAPEVIGEIARRAADWSGGEDLVLDGDPSRSVQRIAVAPGRGDHVVGAACMADAHILVTGELSRRARREAGRAGLAVVGLGRAASERAIVGRMVDIIRRAGKARGLNIDVQGYTDRRE